MDGSKEVEGDKTKLKRLTHLSLFSGIGGLDLSAEMAGIETVGQCEWADYQTKVLEKHWPDVPRWRDIKDLTGESFYERTGLRTVDIISGGFPCQPFSVAGYKRGKDDDRYLWPEMLRVIRELQPTWVLGENVPGIINLALDTVLADLENAGYTVQTFIIPACGVDAPHKRERCAILAYANDERACYRQKNVSQDVTERFDIRRGTSPDDKRSQWKDQSAAAGMADGLRTGIYQVDPNAYSNRLQGWCDDQVVSGWELQDGYKSGGVEQHNKYVGLLREFLECTPLGKIGLMNPNWIEWLMGYPIGWTELNVSETQ